ncbi:Hypothetical protein CINCED_3A004734 [Cinara cedri]|uniref:PHD finger protein 10 n=1 Tax=Cinara cedri TaxID=506608 RepID=A0A5E4N2L4_9HEMI|nr:Hypothetical protein CINCED_3A004734 [Cinara cedri]
MDEDEISNDVSDKRKVEDYSINPKPNPKRIKLVRPVFSPVTKPSISTTPDTNKIDVQTTEVPRPSNLTDQIHNTTDISQTNVKSINQQETTKMPIDLQEHIKKSVAVTLAPEEQVDSSSDALDIQNIFSEETKKELEHLKRNIFKIEDDGSSSENDSQPKRPRLKRPTFVKKMFDKTNETAKLDLTKSAYEENINKIDTEDKIDKITENNVENIKVNEVYEHSNNHIIEKNSFTAENINKVAEYKSVTSTIIDSVKQKLNDETKENPAKVEKLYQGTDKVIKFERCVLEIKHNDTKIEKDNTEIKYDGAEIKQDGTEIKKDDTGIKQDDIEIKHNDSEIEQKAVEENTNVLFENKPIDIDKTNHTAEEQINQKQILVEENIVLKKEINECSGLKIFTQSNSKVVLEDFNLKHFLESKDEKLISSTTHKVENEGIKIAIKTNTEEYTENTNNQKAKTETDNIEDLQVDKTIENLNDNEMINLKNENHKSNRNINEDEYKCSDMSTNKITNLDTNQKLDENESQIFKSDILKAALMSKKSSESLVNSPETNDQSDTNDHLLETKTTEILPKIGQDAIVNKIEAEIKLATKDQPANNKKSQNKTFNNGSEINYSKRVSSPTDAKEIVAVDNVDDPLKWGSAKMNEVEKFLNDSNVTITPICKSQESPKLGKITLKLPKVGNPEIKSETTVSPDVKSELIKKITNKQIAMGDSPLKSALSLPSKSFNDFATIRPAPKPSAEQIALLEQQILNTPKKRGRPSKVLAQQKQLLLQYQQQQQQLKVQEGSTEDEPIFHVPLFDMEDMSGGTRLFESFEASTPKKGKSIRGKGSRGRRGRGGSVRGRDESDSDTTSSSRRIDDEVETYVEEMMNAQDEENKQVAKIEAERLRKEEEREKKLEARKKKLKERNDLLKEKKLKKKQKAEERRLQWHEKKRLMQEEKARAAEMKKSLPPPQNFDDETRMSADCNNSRSQTPARNFIIGEEDLSISGTTNDSIRLKKGRMEVIDLESNKTLTVDQIAEYQWPLEGGELYMIQEQISNFLGVKSFKRKYPGLKRRNVEAEERTFLCDSGLVAESLCDLGLTVLYSSEVLDIMYTDFPEKYEELREYMRLKHTKELSNRQRALMTISSNTDGSKLDLRDRAMEAVANWNSNLNKSRLESRKCSMDMQTFIVHYPKNKCKKMTVPKSKIGSYPLALLPGQFCDYYATYSSEDLRYLPVNTVMYGPLKSVDKDFPVSLSSQSESEDSSSDDSSDSDDSIDTDNKLETNDSEYDPSDKKGAECKLCLNNAEKNKKGTVEPLINCSKCLTIYHPTCLDMTLEMIPYIKRYNWQCNECKSCAQCKEVADEDKMLFCDLCDRGYHIYCVGLRRVPEGRWHCQECAMCSSCGVSDPGPGDSKWFYEFKKIEKTGSKVYCRTLCAPCSRVH